MGYYKCDSGILRCGDCKDEMKTLPDNHVTGIVTDPPYGLKFMGKKWDYDIPSVEIFKEMYRVLKPGGTMLCFAGSRTQHRMAVNIEDAGFELRDVIMWVYGSGFPKSYNIGKGVDKKLGNERKIVGKKIDLSTGKEMSAKQAKGGSGKGIGEGWDRPWRKDDKHCEDMTLLTKGNTIWEGMGTALKPAYEPIIIAMKPNDGGFVDNALKHGVAGINIDGCRVGTEDNLNGGAYAKGSDRSELNGDERTEKGKGMYQKGKTSDEDYTQPQGRFPANIIHDGSDEVLGLFPNSKGQQGDLKTYRQNKQSKNGIYGKWNEVSAFDKRGDSGSAARFFYCAKASKSERNAGCEKLEIKRPDDRTKTGMGSFEEKGVQPQSNNHPTVKPLPLMTYLTKLVKMPENTLILDPFAGSGSTLLACIRNNINFIGIEMSGEYCEIAKARIENERSQLRIDLA